MPKVEKLSIALTSEIAATVREAVTSGEYVSSSEVVREALREWKLRHDLYRQEIKELRKLWEEGRHSGPGQFGDLSTIKAEARRRAAENNAI